MHLSPDTRSHYTQFAVNRPTGTTRQKILDLLKLKGPQTSVELATEIGVTAVAVRQHIQALSRAGLLESAMQKRGVGRPARRWKLTTEADTEFPDDSQRLALDLLEAMLRGGDSETAGRVFEQLNRIRSERYLERMPPDPGPFEKRLARLTELRDEEGYMAEYAAAGPGCWRLIENHCPIRAAAEQCGALCTLEPRLFECVLGEGVTVRHTEQVRAAGQHCSFEIREATTTRLP
jgi:predicted ArsR family transcriptional regulator